MRVPRKEGAMSEIKIVDELGNKYAEELKAIVEGLDLPPELNEMVQHISAAFERDLTKRQLAKLLALYHIMVEDTGIFDESESNGGCIVS